MLCYEEAEINSGTTHNVTKDQGSSFINIACFKTSGVLLIASQRKI